MPVHGAGTGPVSNQYLMTYQVQHPHAHKIVQTAKTEQAKANKVADWPCIPQLVWLIGIVFSMWIHMDINVIVA